MIERAIENWLTSTNERNYQTPFCQVLLHKGHKVIYQSSHRPMEQGKDIITIDEKGECCAYQLKTGNIDLRKWREISGEIKELIELPVIHPSIDKGKLHKSFLVTNGDITDEVRIQIDQINDDNKRKGRNYSYLDIINGQALLKEFIDAQGDFIPKELDDFDLFLKLFLSDGADFLPRDRFFDFLYKTFFKDANKQRSTAINAIASSVIITAYCLNPYQLRKNHYAIFEAWICLSGSILRYAKKERLRKEDWFDSYKLAISEAIRNLISLKEETLGREDFLEGDWMGDGDIIYRARATIVLGGLSALETYLQRADKEHPRDTRLLKLVKDNIRTLFLWGESSFPYFFSIIKYLEINGETQAAQSFLNGITIGVIEANDRNKEEGIPNPYYSVSEIYEALLVPKGKEIDFKQFPGGSYTLESMIMMMARRGVRDILEQNWRNISYIQLKEFRPDNIEDTFSWLTRQGVNHSEFPKATQSWAELKKEATDLEGAPKFYIENLGLLHFFILVCPHRANKTIIGLLDGR